MTSTHWGHESEKQDAEKPVAKKPEGKDKDTKDTPVDPDANVLLEGNPVPFPYPDAKNRPRRIVINGVNVEHVSESVDGVWTYRPM